MTSRKDGASVVGIGAAACAACCAGPILGFLAAVGLAGVVGFALLGLFGVAMVAVIGLGLLRRRRRVSACTPAVAETVALDPPTVRT